MDHLLVVIFVAMEPMNKKIIITGTTCSGKTTLGKKLSAQLSITQIDLDDLYFLPNWKEKHTAQFLNDIEQALGQKENWIITGNYNSKVKDTIWKNATTIIWLNYPLRIIFYRYFKRTIKRVLFKEKCCGENYETIQRVFSADSLFFWIFKSYWVRKKRLKIWMNGMFSEKKWIVLESPKSTNHFLTTIR